MGIDWGQDSEAGLKVAAQLVDFAKSAGARVAEAGFAYGQSTSVTYRDGEVSELEQSDALNMSLRVWVGDRVAALASNQLDRAGLKALAEQAVERARHLPANPDISLPERPEVPTRHLDMDPSLPGLQEVIGEAKALYEAAMAVPGIVNSDGGTSAWQKTRTALVASNGLAVTSQRSGFYRGLSVEAGTGDQRVRDFDGSAKPHRTDLKSLQALVQRATDRALAAVGARPVAGFVGSVVFEPRVAKSLIGGFLGAINGASIVRGQSFLKQALGESVFASQVQIVDDPTLPRGSGSRIIDSEGHVPMPLDLVTDGVLQTWLLDRRSAAKLGLRSNARGVRGGGGTVSPSSTNVLVSGGGDDQAGLLAGIKHGLFVTQMMGQGLNPLTGDYSRGASGFLIENGKLTQPVQAMTVAGAMGKMFASLVLGNDIDTDGSLHVPSLLVPDLAISGHF